MKPVNPSLDRREILLRIEHHLRQIDEWSGRDGGLFAQGDGHYENAFKYQAKAEALIELLEVDDCGSHGGVDRGRGQGPTQRRSLRERYEWLLSLPIGGTGT